MNIAVLGAGMVGSAIARDLATTHQVTAFDRSEAHLQKLQQINPAIRTRQCDLTDFSAYQTLLQPFDAVALAVPGFMGFEALRHVIEAGKNVVDISFFPEDALELDALAKARGVTAIVDCGVAPGMSNLIVGRHDAEMRVDAFEIYVGGLPQQPQPPFLYKAPFSPIDVIEEYTRPARLMENGRLVTRPALTDRELLYFEGVGHLEAFNTDGLRSLLFTLPHIPNQKEKTLRYPGHLDLMLAFRQAGFFSETPVAVDGRPVIPLHLTAQLLIDQWKLGENEPELTVMQVKVHGEGKTICYDLLDKYDPVSGISSMARSTGFTCTAAVELLLQQRFTQTGVFPPERVGKDAACFDFILQYLRQRGVNWVQSAA
ncbi:MAG: saccharopine dehydrogenase C-terminal domain-containing protein [Lacibacter sp.]